MGLKNIKNTVSLIDFMNEIHVFGLILFGRLHYFKFECN